MSERRGGVFNTPALSSGGPGLKFRPGDRLTWQKAFVVFLSHSKRNAGIVPQTLAKIASFHILSIS
jgi:hypothetical protein